MRISQPNIRLQLCQYREQLWFVEPPVYIPPFPPLHIVNKFNIVSLHLAIPIFSAEFSHSVNMNSFLLILFLVLNRPIITLLYTNLITYFSWLYRIGTILYIADQTRYIFKLHTVCNITQCRVSTQICAKLQSLAFVRFFLFSKTCNNIYSRSGMKCMFYPYLHQARVFNTLWALYHKAPTCVWMVGGSHVSSFCKRHNSWL